MGELRATPALAVARCAAAAQPAAGEGARFRSSGMTPFRTPGHRFAMAANPSLGPDGGPCVCVAVADPDGHPFDLGPVAVLDVDRVDELLDALSAWRAEVAR